MKFETIAIHADDPEDKSGCVVQPITQTAGFYFETAEQAANAFALKEEVDIPWTKSSVKEFMWRPIQMAMLNKKSTTELDTINPKNIYEVLDRHLSQKFGIHVEWPCKKEDNKQV